MSGRHGQGTRVGICQVRCRMRCHKTWRDVVQNTTIDRARGMGKVWLMGHKEVVQKRFSLLHTKAVAQAGPSWSQAVVDGFGSAWGLSKPKPPQAKPKPWI